MSEQHKNIDRLFQEKFKDFEPIPDNDVWQNITAKLEGAPKRRRVIPIWWTVGGVAAAVAILLWLGNFGKASPELLDQPQVVDAPVSVDPNDATDTKSSTIDLTQEKVVSVTNKDDVNTKKKDALLNSNPKKKSNVNLVAAAQRNNEALAERMTPKKETLEEKTGNIVGESLFDTPKATDIVATNTSVGEVSNKNNAEEVLEITKEQKVAKKSIFEELEKENKVEVATTKASKRWSITPNVAPVYFNGIGEGSPVSSEFVNNSKSGQTNMSYGIQLAYEVSDKVSIRAGINNVNYGFNTDGVSFSNSISSVQNLNTINYNAEAANVLVFNQGSDLANLVSNQGVKGELTAAKIPIFEGSMMQQLNYVEIPLEVAYKIVDKKIGVQILGGVSSLFLTDNNILLESNSLITELGEATNVNDLNFSTNIGLGIDYKITKKILINMEPMFKYQLNTFSNSFGDFKPYSLGVYTGLKLKF